MFESLFAAAGKKKRKLPLTQKNMGLLANLGRDLENKRLTKREKDKLMEKVMIALGLVPPIKRRTVKSKRKKDKA